MALTVQDEEEWGEEECKRPSSKTKSAVSFYEEWADTAEGARWKTVMIFWNSA